MKKDIRQSLLTKLKQMDESIYLERSYEIITRFLSSSLFQPYRVIGVTISNFPEVDTLRFIESCWDRHVRVAVPKCDPKTKEMTFYEIHSFEDLENVYIHLKEPNPDVCKEVLPEELSLIVVPGVAFVRNGYRIGFGGGYYDRYLLRTNALRCSFAFSEQLLHTIPMEQHDLPVNIIFTEIETIDCKKEREQHEKLF